jgi:hypothetical protein
MVLYRGCHNNRSDFLKLVKGRGEVSGLYSLPYSISFSASYVLDKPSSPAIADENAVESRFYFQLGVVILATPVLCSSTSL